MIVRYTPTGAETREWSFRADRLLSAEGEEIERRTGMDFDDWLEKLPPATFSMRAIHGLLFVLMKRDMPTLKWDQVSFTASELEFELELDEKVASRDALRELLAAGKVPDSMVEATQEQVDAFDAEISEAESGEPEPPREQEGPKAPVSPISGTAGGLHSLPSSESTPATSNA